MKRLICLASLVFTITAVADVPYSPTTEGELPAAILGNAGPLLGSMPPITLPMRTAKATWPSLLRRGLMAQLY